MEQKFFQLLKDGLATPEQIEEYIDRWHDDPKAPKSVLTYLGMTWGQYAEFLEKGCGVLQKYRGHTTTRKRTASKKP